MQTFAASRTGVRSCRGFTLVEVMVAVVILALIGMFIYYGARSAINISEKGKRKVEAVSVLGAATDRLAATDLNSVAGKLERKSTEDSESGYDVWYSVTSTTYGVYRLEVQVRQGDATLASNVILVPKP